MPGSESVTLTQRTTVPERAAIAAMVLIMVLFPLPNRPAIPRGSSGTEDEVPGWKRASARCAMTRPGPSSCGGGPTRAGIVAPLRGGDRGARRGAHQGGR